LNSFTLALRFHDFAATHQPISIAVVAGASKFHTQQTIRTATTIGAVRTAFFLVGVREKTCGSCFARTIRTLQTRLPTSA
jgi:hypothetical protein